MLKLAFLFLTINSVFHSSHWKDFFKGYTGRYSVYVHSKKRTIKDVFFKPFIIPVSVPTSWEHTMRAQIALLKAALHDPENAKFIFVSESTVPLQNFSTCYDKLLSHDKSQFVMQKNPHIHMKGQKRLVKGISLNKQQKHSQWIVLNRKHAEILVANERYLDSSIICDNEHFPGTVLAAHNCLKDVIAQDVTYVNWSKIGANGKTPFTFTNFYDAEQLRLLIEAQRDGFLFARKIDKDCNLMPIDYILPYRH